MTQETPIYKKALTEEHLAIASILDACLTGNPRELPKKIMTASDLDREAAEQGLQRVIATIGGKTSEDSKMSADITAQCLDIAAFFANRQEDQRVRRDTKIMRANHKRLMLGCLQTLYWRDQALIKSKRV